MKIDRLRLIESLEAKNKAMDKKYQADLAEVKVAQEAYKKAVAEESKKVWNALKGATITSFSTSEEYSWENGEKVVRGTRVWISITDKVDLREPNRNDFGLLNAIEPHKVDTYWVGGVQTNKYQQREQVIESLKLSDDEQITLTVSIKGLL